VRRHTKLESRVSCPVDNLITDLEETVRQLRGVNEEHKRQIDQLEAQKID